MPTSTHHNSSHMLWLPVEEVVEGMVVVTTSPLLLMSLVEKGSSWRGKTGGWSHCRFQGLPYPNGTSTTLRLVLRPVHPLAMEA